jgi:carbonic anhydrase
LRVAVSGLDDLLRNNERYAASFDMGSLERPPQRKLAVVTCMDARLEVHAILGLRPGDAHVIRNAGGVVTEDVLRSLELSRSLGTEEVVLMLHTDCAGREGDLEEAVRDEIAEIGGRVSGMIYDVETGRLRRVA